MKTSIETYAASVYKRLFGSFDQKSFKESVKIPDFSIVKAKIDDLSAKAEVQSLEEFKKEVETIEENIYQNFDTIVDAIEDVLKRFDGSKKDMQINFSEFMKTCADKKLQLVASDKYAELLASVATAKTSSKTLNDMSKRLIKENTSLSKEIKSVKEKVDEAYKEIAAMKERESTCS